MTKTVLLVQCCDKNSWIWPYWYEYFKLHWDWSSKIDVVMMCETITPEFPKIQVYNGGAFCWSQRLKNFCESHAEVETIIYSVEDHFLVDPVKIKELKSLIRKMRQRNIDYISLHVDKYMRSPVAKNNRTEYKDLVRIGYEHNLVWTMKCALFKREFLSSMLFPPESIWDTEINGHERIRKRGIKTYIYNDIRIFAFYELLRRGEIEPHKAKFLWAIDGIGKVPEDDKYLDKYKTPDYYKRWQNKINPKTLRADYLQWVK